MSSNRGIVVVKPKEAAVKELSVPKLQDDYLLVKVKAIALNPTDWKHVTWAEEGTRIGCDYAGIVEEVGSKVTKSFRKGDRVFGFAHGSHANNHDDGAFQEHIIVKGDVQMKIPDNLSFEEAATLGVGTATVGQALYQSLELPLPNKPAAEKSYLLIYGGSTATGSLAIQYAKQSGLTVITTASPQNFDYLKSLGADAVFDYKDPSCAQKIREFSNDSITRALDCIGEGDSTKITVSSLSPSGGIYSTILAPDEKQVREINEKVETRSTLAYTIFGYAFPFRGNEVPAKPQDFEFAKVFLGNTEGLLEQGKVKVHKVSLNKTGNGLEGALEGMKYMQDGKVSGEKLVYTID